MDEREGKYQDFLSKIFSLTVPKKSRRGTIRESMISNIEKIYASEGYVTIFRRKIFCLTAPKHFLEEPFYAVFQNNSSSEKVFR